MKIPYDSIYLSPHLDDVTLSCGGQIYMQEARVLIVTVMAGDLPGGTVSEYAKSLHSRWEIDTNVVARRRAEDAAACKILGADYLHWNIPDCIYRSTGGQGGAFYNSDDDIFGPVHDLDKALVNEISKRLQDLPRHSRLVVPLGVGHHVDHQMTRQAAELACPDGLIYYEEYPYAAAPTDLYAAMQDEVGSWQATTIPLSADAIQAKIEAIAAYKSQLSTFFRSRSDLEHNVRLYNKSVGGERLWYRQRGL